MCERCRERGEATAAMQRGPFFRSPEAAARHYEGVKREFLLRCEPYVRIMMDLRNMQSVRYQVSEHGGMMEMEVLWREKDKQMYDQCQDMIDQIREQYQPGGG